MAHSQRIELMVCSAHIFWLAEECCFGEFFLMQKNRTTWLGFSAFAFFFVTFAID